MPLKKSKSKSAFKANIRAEVKAGRPVKQAVAICFFSQAPRRAQEVIAPDAKPWRHDPPYKRIDITRLGRRRVITLEDVQNNVVREPDPAVYSYDGHGTWTLRE